MSSDDRSSKRKNIDVENQFDPRDSAENESDDTMQNRNQEGDWVNDSLRKLYTSTLDEDIPQDMLSLLDQLDDAMEAGDTSSSKVDEETKQ